MQKRRGILSENGRGFGTFPNRVRATPWALHSTRVAADLGSFVMLTRSSQLQHREPTPTGSSPHGSSPPRGKLPFDRGRPTATGGAFRGPTASRSDGTDDPCRLVAGRRGTASEGARASRAAALVCLGLGTDPVTDTAPFDVQKKAPCHRRHGLTLLLFAPLPEHRLETAKYHRLSERRGTR